MILLLRWKSKPFLSGSTISMGMFKRFRTDLTIMKLAFVKFMKSLFTLHQFFTLISSAFTVLSSSLGSLDEKKMLVSSANSRNESFSKELVMSFM